MRAFPARGGARVCSAGRGGEVDPVAVEGGFEGGEEGQGVGAEEAVVGVEGAGEEVGPDVEGVVGEGLFDGDELALFFCGWGGSRCADWTGGLL